MMVSRNSLEAAFLTGPALPSTRRPTRAPICRATASVETSSEVSVQVSTEHKEAKAVISIAADCKAETSKFLLDLASAVNDVGLQATRINVLPLAEVQPMTSEFLVDATVSDAVLTSLQSRVDSAWSSLPAPPPPRVKSDEPELVPYDVADALGLSEDALESGAYFYVDPYAHAKWTTVTTICPTNQGYAEKVLAVLAEQKANVVFCTIRSVRECATGFATDVYYIQTLQGEPLIENERITLNNALVKVLEP